MSAVSLRDVVKRYGPTQVIHGLSLDVEAGEFVVFVGPSGCGKSTLLRMIAGLESFQSGSVEIGGRVVNALPARERDIAMVFQDYALYPHMSVRQNLGFGLKMRRVDRSEIERRVAEAARVLQIEHLLARRPRELSGGQRQRVAMGRAIVRDPAVFLFDEPLSNLDAKLRVDMRTEIKRLHRSLRATMIYVTHDQVEAMTMADRIVVMNAGNIEQIGTPQQVYRDPANRFVAGFIGAPAMNFLPATADAGHLTLPGGASVALASPPAHARVDVGIRPEHVLLDPDGIRVTVDVVEPLGSDTLVSCRLGDATLLARFGGEVLPQPGESIGVRLPPERLLLFDASNGRRL